MACGSEPQRSRITERSALFVECGVERFINDLLFLRIVDCKSAERNGRIGGDLTAAQRPAPPTPAGRRRHTMTHEVMMNEKRYLACLNLIQRMHEKKLLTDEEYAQARQLLIDQYQPKISVLFE